MTHRFHALVSKIIGLEASPVKLAASCSLGIFWAWSPFLGIQTVLALASAWLCRLNATVVMIVLYVVNNPVTMVPIIVLDYFTGYYIFKKLLNCPPACMPRFLDAVDAYVRKLLARWAPGIEFSFFYYLAGGMLLAAVLACVSYPFLYYAFRRLNAQRR